MGTGTGFPLTSVDTLKKKITNGAPGWLSRLSVRLRLRSRSRGHDLAVREFEPCVASGLMAQSLEPASDSVSPSLSAPPPFMLCLSLSQKSINVEKKI